MLKEFDDQTIAAISTPLGEGGIGVIRLSGKEAIPIADRIFKSKKNLRARYQKSFTAQVGHVVSRELSGQEKIIDEVLLLVMRAPKSFTCEDVVEISAHGGNATLRAILELVIKAGARLAAKGEFTKRAFLNGRIDLLQAEAVLDLVKAKTELGRQWATAQLEGVLSKKMRSVKQELLDILTHLEASIDFPDDLLRTAPAGEIRERLRNLSKSLRELLSSSNLGSIVKNGLNIVIAGRPNVGKSSLMNRLVRSSRVIVTPYPGTTRDVVEEEIEIKGFPVRVLDTAGIQETDHPIEREGIERTKKAVEESDLVLYVMDSSQALDLEDLRLLQGLLGKIKIIVVNKSDLPQRLDRGELSQQIQCETIVESSCVTENGLKALEDEIFCFITNGRIRVSEEVVVSSVRQRDLLERTLKSVEDAEQACQENASAELIAVDVRLSLDHLGVLTGEVLTEDVLEALFNQFCIGK